MNRLGRLVVNFSMQRFRDQNWLDVSPDKWQQRKRSRGSTGRDRGAILVDTGRLRRSVRIVSLSGYNVIVGSDVPYAKMHNEGSNETITVPAHQRQLSTRVVERYTTKTGNERSRTTRQATGTVADVKEHTRKQNMPARTFLAPSHALAYDLEKEIAETFFQNMKVQFNNLTL